MFQSSNFNQPLNNWNTSHVTNMRYMFLAADNFNQNLSSWTVNPNVTNCVQFSTNTFWTLGKPGFTSCTP
jgi:surface protein